MTDWLFQDYFKRPENYIIQLWNRSYPLQRKQKYLILFERQYILWSIGATVSEEIDITAFSIMDFSQYDCQMLGINYKSEQQIVFYGSTKNKVVFIAYVFDQPSKSSLENIGQ